MIPDPTPAALEDLAVLADPVRRRLYLHVLAQDDAVSRDAAARAAGIGRPLAAFHLDRLVQAGLLEAEYRRLSGRTGPGAGRPSKLYRATARVMLATVPPRRYDVAAELFASALDEIDATDATAALRNAATREGSALGGEARRLAGKRAGASRRMEGLRTVLADAGYHPAAVGGELRMRNCPFSGVAERHRTVTCGMNLALIESMLEVAGLDPAAARLDMQPNWCCVAIDAISSRA
jgi:predicted ArsR family transcriptional regulator